MSGYSQLPPQQGIPQPPHTGGPPYQPNQSGPAYAVPQYNVVQVQQPGVYVKPYSNQMIFSIFVCLLCFWPIGLYTIYLSSQANDALARSDMVRAGQLSSQAKTLNWVAFCVGLVCVLIPILIFAVFWGVWFHTAKVALRGFTCENSDGETTFDCRLGECGSDNKSGCSWCDDGYLVSDDGLCTSFPMCTQTDSTHKTCTGCDVGYTLKDGRCSVDQGSYTCYKTPQRLGLGTTHCEFGMCGFNDDNGCTSCEDGWTVDNGGCTENTN